jgi:predicted transcriptional regulator
MNKLVTPIDLCCQCAIISISKAFKLSTKWEFSMAVRDFSKMKRDVLEHYLFIANQFYDTANSTEKADIDAARTELERRQAKKGTKTSKAEQAVLDVIRNDHGGDIVTTMAERKFNKGTLRRLVEKELLKKEGHSYLRTDDMETVYYSVYKINTPLDAALSE